VADEPTEDEAGAERAFEDLRAEVLRLRRAIEVLPGAWQAARPAPSPDYGPDLSQLVKTIGIIAERLKVIEAHPALKVTPEHYEARIGNVGNSVFREAERVLGRAVSETRDTGKALASMIGQMRGQRAQRGFVLFWGSIAALCAMLLGLVGSPFMARYLPFGWNQDVAATVMGNGRWKAGATLMENARPNTWRAIASDWDLLSNNQANAKSLAQCRKLAAETHKPQDCLITVKAGQ
jgi:hypothetical protein